ncbi:MAG: hypothetical protein ACD_21C00241G0003 [uncultured bacterium]|nr:MAG: hypothetical protein ACD_21C00241G0003 [uncultured bacterium]
MNFRCTIFSYTWLPSVFSLFFKSRFWRTSTLNTYGFGVGTASFYMRSTAYVSDGKLEVYSNVKVAVPKAKIHKF